LIKLPPPFFQDYFDEGIFVPNLTKILHGSFWANVHVKYNLLWLFRINLENKSLDGFWRWVTQTNHTRMCLLGLEIKK